MEDLSSLRAQFKEELSLAVSLEDIEKLRLSYFGRKGIFPGLMEKLKETPAEKRPELGKKINSLKEELLPLCEEALSAFAAKQIQMQLSGEKLDVSLPGVQTRQGRLHPLRQLCLKMVQICKEMGFSVQYGFDVDSDYYNYEGLNFPEDHPARDMQDTFYITSQLLLRSHTSNTQLRAMEKWGAPLRIIVPGTVFRNEDISARSHVFFHQLEGLYIEENVSMADLFSTMQLFWRKLFNKEVEVRFRPSYFPFVEPGVEVDISCAACEAKGCRLCKNSGWLEVAGAGMVHPQVLINGGIDPERYTGFAWGLGIERLAMLMHKIPDIRLFSENRIDFLQQFS